MTAQLPDDLVDDVIESWPRCSDERPLSSHLLAEIASTFTGGPLEVDQLVPDCTCTLCYPTLDDEDPPTEAPPKPISEGWRARVEQARDVDLAQITAALGLGEPKRAGRELAVCCPLHRDSTPSLRFDLARGVWYCDPCGMGGDGIDLVRKALRTSFREAINWLHHH